MKEVNLRTPNASHPSMQDEKSSLVGAANDLIAKYSDSCSQQSPNFNKALLSAERASNVMTQTLTTKGKKPTTLQLAQNVSLMKKKHVSTLTSPGPPMIIDETSMQQQQ